MRFALSPFLALSALIAFRLGMGAAPVSPSHTKPGAGAVVSSPLLRGLTLHDRIAQLIVVRGYGDYPSPADAERKRFEHWIHDEHVGGFIVAGRIRNGNVLAANPFELAAFVNHTQRLARTPLLVASDFERGASMRVGETAAFPYMMAFGAARELSATRALGEATAREARAIGVNWVFAPDADVNNNPDNPIINMRSFGEDPEAVAANVGAFIDGAHSDAKQYVLVSAKHFPGHGDTAEDSHMQLARLDVPKERLESIEFVPFRAAIAHGADSVMTAHIAVPALDTNGMPSTLSKPVLTGILRDELEFKGLIVTDALEMAGITSLLPEGEAAVRAIEAGADVLLMPTDPEVCIKAITAAIASGRLKRQRIDASAARVLAAKQKVGLFRSRTVAFDDISKEIRDKQLDDLAEGVAEHALTLYKDDAHLFPMPLAGGSCLAILTEAQFSQRGELLAHDLRRGAADLRVYLASSATADPVLDAMAADMATCKQIYAVGFVTVAANRGSVALEGGLNRFVDAVAHGRVPLALVSMGNPYLLRQFPSVAAYLATFSTASTSESALARALLGQIPITGRSPVSIPGLAKIGDGIPVAAKLVRASNQ